MLSSRSAPGAATAWLDWSGADRSVVVWDESADRLSIVAQVIASTGARPRRFDQLSAFDRLESSPHCSVALVALATGQPSLEARVPLICESLRQKGFAVIAYDEGVDDWPLEIRCRSFLAGCVLLLDSRPQGFAAELRRALEQILLAEAEKRDEDIHTRLVMRQFGIVATSDTMLAVCQGAIRFSHVSDVPVFISGETGTGKELLARAVYALDAKRRSGPFVAVNSSAISSSLAESELFGHRRGAFTGADRDRPGLIRSAAGGVLFLDEIGDLEGALQTKLLRVLQESRVLAVGAEREEPIDVRVVAASNRDLPRMIEEGRFRADLFHRFSALTIHVPPLRERRADIPALIAHFIDKHRALHPSPLPAAGPDFVEAVSRVELRGNVRQLENLVRWALVHKGPHGALRLSDLPPEVWRELADGAPAAGEAADVGESPTPAPRPLPDVPGTVAKVLQANAWNLSRSLHMCEKWMLEAALRRASGNRGETARLLGITARSVYNKIHQHDLEP
jgi:DNA-binding NtrC family response regulator